jgi:hypothetical protein
MTTGFQQVPAFRPNSRVNVRVRHLGREHAPVVIIDDFLANVHELVDYAASEARFRAVQDNFYPGIRAPLPLSYMHLLFKYLPGLVFKEFRISGLDASKVEGDFSIVTTLPSDLHPAQCVPHIDTPDTGQIAALHYLCGSEHGGTAFYRHRRTGFESMTVERGADYQAALQEDLRSFGPPERNYVNSDTPIFEIIGAIEAAFNRLILYRSAVLHSGSIGRDYRFDSNPRTGRLTANAFLHFDMHAPGYRP